VEALGLPIHLHHESYENAAMAKDKEPLEVFTATAEQMTAQTQGTMED
jgi:hypothetical protein